MMEPNTTASLDRERRRRRGDRGENASRWKHTQQTHARKVDFRCSQPCLPFGLLLVLLYTNACYNLGLATTKPPLCHAISLRRALRALSTSWRGLTELDRAVSCRDQAWPCRVVIKHAIDHALPLT